MLHKQRRMMADYRGIHRLIKFTKNIAKAREEWGYFLKDYPNFSAKDDPENLTLYFEQQRLLAIMLDMQRPITERAQVGRDLGNIGDPRPGVGLRADGIPDIVWCEVPGKEQGGPPIIIGGDAGAWQSLYPQWAILSDFAISKYPITYRQFQAFIEDKGFENDQWWEIKDDRSQYNQSFRHWNHPRDSVTWYAAMAYCKWLSAKLGYEVRLPTEEEWEKAARGAEGRVFPWGNEYISGYANLDERYNKTGPFYLEQTSAVGIYPLESASPYGVMDMAGNVWEWTLSAFSEEARIQEKKAERTLHTISERVLRGGSWYDEAFYSHGASRYPHNPSDGNFGFRVVRRLPL